MDRIRYECGVCGWLATVPLIWADVKPTYCGNSKCSHSKTRAPRTKKTFKTDPEALKITSSSGKIEEIKVVKTRKKKQKVKDVGPFEEQIGTRTQGRENTSSPSSRETD
jgi:hypothetical protein